MMTKKNYEAAARIVQDLSPTSVIFAHRALSTSEKKAIKLQAKVVCTAFVLLFRDDNPRFDQEHFMKACGVEL